MHVLQEVYPLLLGGYQLSEALDLIIITARCRCVATDAVLYTGAD